MKPLVPVKSICLCQFLCYITRRQVIFFASVENLEYIMNVERGSYTISAYV